MTSSKCIATMGCKWSFWVERSTIQGQWKEQGKNKGCLIDILLRRGENRICTNEINSKILFWFQGFERMHTCPFVNIFIFYITVNDDYGGAVVLRIKFGFWNMFIIFCKELVIWIMGKVINIEFICLYYS